MSNQDQGEQILSASVKASVLTQIFSNMSKQLKQTESFYVCFNSKQLKIVVKELSQSIQIQLNLHAKLFSKFQYSDYDNGEEYKCNKYSLSNFQFFDSFFQTCKGQIKISVSSYRIQFSDQNQKTKLRAKGLFISQNQYIDLVNSGFGPKNDKDQQQQQGHIEILIPKARYFQEVIHTSSAFKEENIQIGYRIDRLHFKINQQVNKILKVIQIQKTNDIGRARYPVKKMKLAASLLQSQKQVSLTLYQDSIVMKYNEENKKSYDIKICCLSRTINL